MTKGLLFYPCCGSDFTWPIKEFGSIVDAAVFVDIAHPGNAALTQLPENATFIHGDAEHAFRAVQDIKVFVFKRDHYVGPGGGEGSSSIKWLDGPLREELLGKLVDDAFLVTDGSNCSLESIPAHWNRSDIAADAPLPMPFSYGGREFRCIKRLRQVMGYGPVYVWNVTGLSRA